MSSIFKYIMKNIQLEKIIIISLLVAFVFVSGTALVSYLNLNKVVENINKASNPDLKLLLLESLTSDLSLAESSVKSYNLTRDEKYLEPYAEVMGKVYQTLDSIMTNVEADVRSKVLVDSLLVLVQDKEDILESILRLRNNEVVTEELKRIDAKLKIADEVNNKVTKSKKLFVSKEERNRIKKAKEDAKPENVLARMKEAIGNEVSGVKSDQLSQLKDIKLQEFQLLKKDQDIMTQIRGLIFQLQEIEKKQIVRNTLEASELTAKTYRVITIFCLLGTLLMLGAALVIYYFIQKSKEYTAALQKANQEIEVFAKAKETFVYNVSHELRTPLNAVIGFSEQLDQEENEDKKIEISQIIYKSAQHLKLILNDILDFSKLNSGKFTLRNVNFHLPQLIQELKLMMDNNSKEKGLNFSMNVTGELPEYLNGDALRLRQILINIIGNAIQYTPEGTVDVNVHFEQREDEKGILKVEVKDTGVGMTEADLQNIFNAFEQASTRAKVAGQGTGLGLSIAKELIERQGGKLEVKSEVGKGSVFTIQIPYFLSKEEELEEQLQTVDVKEIGESIQEARILVVDDVKVNLQLIEYILKKYQLKWTLLEDGHQVIDELNKSPYDLVLLDMNLQGITGKEICQRIRAHAKEDIRNIPVVAVTAAHYSKDVLDEYGFNDILEKPFTEVQLLKMIQKYFALMEEDVKVEMEALFDINRPEHREIIQQAKVELKENLLLLEQAVSAHQSEQIVFALHKLISILHILGHSDLKDEVRIQEALWSQHADANLIPRLDVLIQKLKSIDI